MGKGGPAEPSREVGVKKLFRFIIGTVIAALIIAGPAGCQKQEGPAEKAGKQIDESVEKGGEQLQEAGKEVEKSGEGKQ
jgi:hypothetical protein